MKLGDTAERQVALQERRSMRSDRTAMLEQRVRSLLAEGLRPSEIIERLGNSAKTVLNRRRRL